MRADPRLRGDDGDADGDRATPGTHARHNRRMSDPAAAAPASRPSLRERFDALRNLPPFLRLIWATSPGLTMATLGLRVVRAFLPIATLYVGKLIIDEAVRLVAAGNGFDSIGAAWHSGQLDTLAALLLMEFALAIGSDLLGRMIGYGDALLSELFTNVTSVRLMEHAATLDLEDFEDPDLQDKLDRARRQTMGRMNLMSQLFGQVQDAITVISFAAGLLVFAPWLIVLLAVALVPAFVGEAHFNALGYSLNFAWTPERRQLEYVRQMGAGVETAKEVKIFNLHRFLIAKYRELAEKFFRANRALARRRAAWGTLLAALGTLGYYVAYAYIAWRMRVAFASSRYDQSLLSMLLKRGLTSASYFSTRSLRAPGSASRATSAPRVSREAGLSGASSKTSHPSDCSCITALSKALRTSGDTCSSPAQSLDQAILSPLRSRLSSASCRKKWLGLLGKRSE